MQDFSTYTFRCSGLHNLLTKPKNKGEVLSETAKTYLREIWIKEVYGREKTDVSSKYTSKGVLVESDSLDLYQRVTNQAYFKNRERLKNEWIEGTPDVIIKDKDKHPVKILDIKSSWDIWTFNKVDEDAARKAYYAQMLGYMWLSGATEADLVYCLVNTPEEIIEKELFSLSYKYPELGGTDEVSARFRKNYEFDDIEHAQRIKRYTFTLDELVQQDVKEKVTAAREYLKGLSL